MVDRGAKHLLLSSRSGATGGDVAEFLDEIRAMGVEVKNTSPQHNGQQP